MLQGLSAPGTIEAAETAALPEALSRLSGADFAHQHQAAATLFEFLATMPDAPALALQLGQHIPLTAYGPLAVPMKLAPNAAASLRFLCRYASVEVPLIAPRYTSTDKGCELSLAFRHQLSEAAQHFLSAAAFTALNTELSLLSGKKHNLLSATLPSCPTDYAQLYSEQLKLKIDQAEQISLRISQAVLSSPSPLADPLSFQSYLDSYESKRKDQRHEGIRERVQTLLTSELQAPPSLAEVAEQLSMSERQLRFALQKEATSYRELLRDCRIAFCRSHLAQPRCSISALALKLGYADISAFNHGFKRWTGLSPSEFQRQLQEGEAGIGQQKKSEQKKSE